MTILNLIETNWLILGLFAVAASLAMFFCSKMIALRGLAILANLLFIVYGVLSGGLLAVLLHGLSLPLNILRLYQMKKLISDVKKSSQSSMDFGWLKPHMVKKSFTAGETLFRAGDEANAAYYVVSGVVKLPEKAIALGSGAFFGEMGLFTKHQLRTLSAVCETDVSMLVISYEDFQQLCFQNPKFGFYVIRLMVERLQENAEAEQRGEKASFAALESV